MRDQMQKFKRFSKFIDDDLDTGLNKVQKESIRPKQSMVDKYNPNDQEDFNDSVMR